MSSYDNYVLFYALNTELFLSNVKRFAQNINFKPTSVLKIIEFCLFGDIIFDVTRNTVSTKDNAGNDLNFFFTYSFIFEHIKVGWLVDMIFNVPVNNFSVMLGQVSVASILHCTQVFVLDLGAIPSTRNIYFASHNGSLMWVFHYDPNCHESPRIDKF